MKIPTEEFEKGVKLCFTNVTSLLEDANLLLSKGSNGHALFFVVSAIEETSKAFMYSCGRTDTWSELSRDVINHFQKYSLFILVIFADSFMNSFNKTIQTEIKERKTPKPLKLEEIEELGRDFETIIKEIWKSRLQSLYVDYQQAKWFSPCDIDREEVEELLQYANKYKQIIEPQCSNILSAPPALAKQIQEYLDEQLFPSILKQFQKNIDWLFNNGLIDEKLYKKMLALKK